MEIFYLRKAEFLNSIERESLESFSDGRAYESDDKHIEHLCGLFLTKFAAKHIYGVKKLNIILKGAKPIFEFSNMKFSISHSHDIILVVFNNTNIGADLEYMRQRDYKNIMMRYDESIENPTKEEFYRFWTSYEARIKLGAEPKAIFSTILDDEYMMSCVSDEVLVTNLCVKKLSCKSERLNLNDEFANPKNIIVQQKIL